MATSSILTFISNLFFPSFCVICQREGACLCQDCLSLIDVSNNFYCPFCRPPKIVSDGKTCPACKKQGKQLAGLFFAAPYGNFIIKRVIAQFKYPPNLVKELAKPLASLIVAHFHSLENPAGLDFSENLLMPVPLSSRKLKARGFNQAEEIAQELSFSLELPLISDCLLKTKETLSQVEILEEKRKENVKGAFTCRQSEKIRGKKILLIDDVFTTGSTMEECASVLKTVGAKEIWGVAVARG